MNNKIKFFSSIQFKVAAIFILLLLVTIEIIGAYFVHSLEQQNIESFEAQVQLPSYVTTSLASNLSSSSAKTRRSVQTTINDISNIQNSDIEIVNSQGKIVALKNNNNSQNSVGQRTTNTQIKDVIYSGRKTTQISHNDRDGSYYVSITPLVSSNGDNNTVVGAVYVRANMDQVYKNINNIVFIFFVASLVAGLLGALISIVVARAITRPIAEMRKQAIRMANGDYSGQVRVYSEDELGQLAVAVNNLSVRVEEEQENSDAERNRLDSVLSQMTDGVVATDRHGNITIINEAAQAFLNVDQKTAFSEQLVDLLGINSTTSFDDLLSNQDERIIEPAADSEGDNLILQADFSLIKRNTGFVTGLVCVLHDVTEQRKIDNDRRLFVSNVSHELRTPLTSLRSYVETLNDGAWQDSQLAPRFLKVIQEET